MTLTPDVGAAATLACVLEAAAPKPGNVSPGRPFHDTAFEHFVASAIVIGPEMAIAGARPLGDTIHAAVRATARWARANTNLGIVLLFAPIARAAAATDGTLRERVARVLRETTVADAANAYAAIREASPGGLGQVAEQDVAAAPTITLRGAMALAAGRDAIASEYATDYALTFDTGVPALRTARAAGLDWPDAAIEAFLALLAVAPDTLIARKLGHAEAETVSQRVRDIRDLGGTRSEAGRAALIELDAALRDPRNTRNPGTTADLVAAALFVVILEGAWQS